MHHKKIQLDSNHTKVTYKDIKLDQGPTNVAKVCV